MLRVCLFGIFDIDFLICIFLHLAPCIFLVLDCLDSIWSQFVDALVPERKEKIIAGRCAYASREEWKAEAKDRVF